MVNETNPLRWVVTGHSTEGRSLFLTDEELAPDLVLEQFGASFFDLWQGPQVPAALRSGDTTPPPEPGVAPPAGGYRVLVNDLAPGHVGPSGIQSPLHRTETLDVVVVLRGELVLVLDEGERTLRTGDVVLQCGTRHAWANRGSTTARILAVLVDGAFDPALATALTAQGEGTMGRGQMEPEDPTP